jgi:hypothetical protein
LSSTKEVEDMLILVLLIASIALILTGLVVGLSAFALLTDDAPRYRPKTLRLWFSRTNLRNYFQGGGYHRLAWGGWLIGLGALCYLVSILVR